MIVANDGTTNKPCLCLSCFFLIKTKMEFYILLLQLTVVGAKLRDLTEKSEPSRSPAVTLLLHPPTEEQRGRLELLPVTRGSAVEPRETRTYSYPPTMSSNKLRSIKISIVRSVVTSGFEMRLLYFTAFQQDFSVQNMLELGRCILKLCASTK